MSLQPEQIRERLDIQSLSVGDLKDGDTSRSRTSLKGTTALTLTRFAEIDPAPRKVHLIRDFIGLGDLGVAFGAPGSGKSVLIGDLACHVAARRQWLGRAVHGGAVLYVAAERAALVKRRFAAWRTYHGVADIPLAVLQGAVDLRSSKAIASEIIEHAHRLREEAGAVVLVVIDTVSRALAGGDENSPKDMGALVGNVAMIQEATGATVVLVHHVPADGSQRLRGHGALLGAADVTISIEKAGLIRTATLDKVNDGEEGQRVAFTLESIEIAPETTAPVVVATDTPATPARSKQPSMSKSASTALRAIQEALAASGATAPASNHIPTGAIVVTLDAWREYSYRMGISAADSTPRARQLAFKRASDQLIGNGIVSPRSARTGVCPFTPTSPPAASAS